MNYTNPNLWTVPHTTTSDPYGRILTIILDLNFDDTLHIFVPPFQQKIFGKTILQKIPFVGFDSTREI